MPEEFQPAPLFVIEDRETLKMLAEPLRTQILEVVIPEALSPKQIGEKLGLTPSKLYYHLTLLEKHGLITVVETRTVANLVEKVYRASASAVVLAQDLLSFSTPEGQDTITTLLDSTLGATREDVLRSLQARAFHLEQGAEPQPRPLVCARTNRSISAARASEFACRLDALIAEFSHDEEPADEQALQLYGLTVLFYPSFHYQSGDKPQGDAQ